MKAVALVALLCASTTAVSVARAQSKKYPPVAPDKDIAVGNRARCRLFVADRQRFEIGAVREEDAAIFGAEGVYAGWRDDEAKRRQPRPRHGEARRRQHQMVKGMGCAGHAGAVCIIPEIGSSVSAGGMRFAHPDV